MPSHDENKKRETLTQESAKMEHNKFPGFVEE